MSQQIADRLQGNACAQQPNGVRVAKDVRTAFAEGLHACGCYPSPDERMQGVAPTKASKRSAHPNEHFAGRSLRSCGSQIAE
jgi:hypothetical protein